MPKSQGGDKDGKKAEKSGNGVPPENDGMAAGVGMVAGNGMAAGDKAGAQSIEEGKMPYSPSQSTEAMDWTSNLSGVKELLQDAGQPGKEKTAESPPSILQGEGEPTEKSPEEEEAPPNTSQGEGGPSAQAMARKYIEKMRQKTVEDIKSRMGETILAYNSVYIHNMREVKAGSLLGEGGAICTNAGIMGMVATGDGRLLSGGLKMDLKSKRVMTTSYNEEWGCIKCEKHKTPAFKVRGEAGVSPGRQVVILTDQCYPAILPVNTMEKCLLILRVENASIPALVEEFLKQLGNRRVPQDSLILIFSASYLGAAGLAAYTEDLVTAAATIRDKLGRDTRVGPLPPMLLPGCTDLGIIRSTFELVKWTDCYYGREDDYLEESMKIALKVITTDGEDFTNGLEERRVRLPNSTGKKQEFWNSGGPDVKIPTKVRPTSTFKEKELVAAIISEIRSKLAINLDPSPTFERGLGLQVRSMVSVDYMLVGSSNASKLRLELQKKGRSTSLVFLKNWRVEDGSVESLAVLTRDALRNEDPDTVVLQLLDSSCYYAKAANGGRYPPKKLEDGKFHLEGAVTVATVEMQQEMFENLRPLLEQIGKRKGLIISPLPRYVLGGCCSNERHCTNIKEPSYKANMMTSLAELRKNLKNYLYYTGRKNIRVMDPTVDLRGFTDNEVWAEGDPVHPRPEMYEQLADGVIKMTATTDQKRRQEDHHDEMQPAARRGRLGSGSGSRGEQMSGSGSSSGGWDRSTWESHRGRWTGQRHIRGATRGMGRGTAGGARPRHYGGRGGAY
jgi:hypothetical protein